MSKVKQLNKAYSKVFKHINKSLVAKKENGLITLASDSGLVLFVEHLRYIRDLYIITQQSADTVVTINAAIEEFEEYAKTKKEFHWNNFCEFLKLNMKEWLAANDSV